MISACLIYRGDVPQEAIESVTPLIDEVVSVDSTTVPGAHFETDCSCGCCSMAGDIRDFSLPRNESFARAKNEWVIWLDSDDMINGPDDPAVLEALSKRINEQGVEVRQRVLFPYDYSPTSRFYVARLVPRTERWQYPIHELLSGGREGLVSDAFVWKHQRTDFRETNLRNLKLLTHHMTVSRTMYEHDARMWGYWGLAAIDAGRPLDAINRIETALKLETWNERRAWMAIRLANALPPAGRHYAEAMAWRAVRECPNWPLAWQALRRLYPHEEAFERAASIRQPKTLLPVDPNASVTREGTLP